jgi:hypothetical protein
MKGNIVRAIAVVSVVSLTALLIGCAGVVSLHPVAMPNGKDTVFDPALVGVWEEVKADDKGAKAKYTVDRAESGYSVTMTKGGARHSGTMHLLKIGERYLLDIYSPSEGVPPPAHIFFKLRLDQDNAWLAEMQSDWFQRQIITGGRLRHEVLLDEDGGRIVLTASPAELRRHLLPYVADDRSFDEEKELRRIK